MMAESAPARLASTHARAWVAALRLRTLSASVAPVLVGAALAVRAGAFDALVMAATLAAAVLVQVGVNLANDYYDHLKGVDKADRLGPPRVTGKLLPASRVRAAMLLVLGGAALVGLWLVMVGGWPILAIGLASLACALAYAGGPRPLGHLGLGDLLVLVFFGPLAVAGAFYLHARSFAWEAALAGVPLGALSACILVVNNVRDIATDARAGKRTLAVRLGARASWAEYGALLALSYAVPLALWARGFSMAVLLPLLTAPLALALLRAGARHGSGRGLNRLLVRTAALHAVFGGLFAGGLVL